MEQDHERTADAFTLEETYAATRRPVDLAETLPPAAYWSERFFALERERVFASSWVAVGCTAQLREPGDVLVSDVAGRSIFVVRTRDGELRAFYNTCRHRGTRLLTAGDRRVKRFIRCPYHSWAYDLEGKCIGTPLFEGSPIPEDQQAAFDMRDVRAFDRADYGLLRVAVESLGPARVREPRRGRRDAVRAAGRPARADGRLPPRRMGARPRRPSTTSPPTTSCSPRTSWSTTTCPGSTRAWSRSRRSPRTTAGRAAACTWGSARARSRRTPATAAGSRACRRCRACPRTTRSARASSGCSPTSRSTSCPTTSS